MTSIQIDRTDGLSSATAIKGPCRVATTANISLTGQQTIDGVSVVAGDRVLVKNQTAASENGIWVCDTGPWRRSKDFDGNRDVRKGTRVWVTDGDNGPAEYVVATDNPIVIGTTAISIVLADSQITVVGTGTDFATKQLAEAFAPSEAPLYIRIMGYASAGDGGAALYKKVPSEPAHAGKFSITLADDVTVAWYEIAESTLRPEMFGATPAALYAGAQAALDYLAEVGGGTLHLPSGTYELDTSLVSTGDNVTLLLDDDCIINHDTPDFMAVQLQGDRNVVRGGINGGFVGPAEWDPVDGAGSLPYAVLRFTGEYGRVEGTRVFNIRRVGIQFKDVHNGTVQDCIIDGNQPSPTFPLTLTNHHGIHFDNGAEASGGNFKAIGNTIRACTQGIDLASFGVGGQAKGTVIANNVFEGCWDHGVYTNYADGIAITGNNFNDCHLGVAASGPRHVISGNSFVALSTASGETHVAGVSLRDPQYCVVSDNVFFGTLTTLSPVCIDLGCFTTDICYNVVANNTVRTVGVGILIRLTYRSESGLFVYDNIVEGNNLVGAGKPTEGHIQIEGNPAASGVVNSGNIIRGNRLSLTAEESNGINLLNCYGSLVEGNLSKIEHNAGSAKFCAGIILNACQQVKTKSNLFLLPSGYGTNVQARGLRELTSGLANEAVGNRTILPASLPSGFNFLEVAEASSSSKLLIDIEGSGAPSYGVRAGSRYARTDGGSGTSLYVNQGDGNFWAGK